MKKVSKTVELFLKYDYKGNGKYYTTEQGSRSYRNTGFENFRRLNPECVDIVETGNDAPRGGQTGDFVIVEFNSTFNQKYKSWFEKQNEIEEAESKRQKELQDRRSDLGDQKELLKDYFESNPRFKQKIVDRIENYSSKKWRNWVRMKVCQKIANEDFGLFNLSAGEIKNIALN